MQTLQATQSYDVYVVRLVSNCYCLPSEIKPSKSEIAAIEIQSLFMFSLLAKERANEKRGFSSQRKDQLASKEYLSIWPKSLKRYWRDTPAQLWLHNPEEEKQLKWGSFFLFLIFISAGLRDTKSPTLFIPLDSGNLGI